jgi:hypothetical protein
MSPEEKRINKEYMREIAIQKGVDPKELDVERQHDFSDDE